MSLADKVAVEQAAVAKGAEACAAPHPAGDVESDCVRVVHLPDDTVHVGLWGSVLVQWENS